MEKFKEARLVDRLEIKLTEDQETALSTWIDQQRDDIEQERGEFLQRQKKYLYSYDDFVTFVRKGPWDGSSNVHIPLTVIMGKAFHSRLYNIFANEDTTTILPREDYDEKMVNVLKMLRSWYIWDYINGYNGIKGVTDEICHDTVHVGVGLALKTWQIKQRKIMDLVRNDLMKEMKDAAPQMQEEMAARQKNQKRPDKKIDIKPYKEIQKIVTVFEGSRVISVPFENAFFPNFIPESSDMDYPLLVLLQNEMTVSEIMMKAASGEWEKDKCDEVINEGRGETLQADEIKGEKNRLSGIREDAGSIDRKAKRVMEYCFCTYDIDGDGFDEEIVVTRSSKGTIVKINYLDRISPSGRRPVFKFDCFKKPRQAYSRGVPEFLHNANETMDLDANMRRDYLQLQACPFGTYRSTSSLKNRPIRIAPGVFIPCDETNDLKPFTFQSNAGILSSEEDRWWHYAERMASVSSINQGIVPENVGPTRSTSGVISLLQQMDKEFKPMVEHNARQWRKLELALLEDLDYRLPLSIKMKVLGAAVEDVIDPKDIDNVEALARAILVTGGLDFKIDVASVINSDEVRRNEATIIMDKLAAPTLAPQFGVVTPKTLFKAYSDWLKTYGRDVKQFLDEPVFVSNPLTLWQEVQVCGQGQIPPMSMRDDHEAKAAGLQAFMQTPEYAQAKTSGMYVPQVDDWMMKTIKKHLVLAEALKPRGQVNNTGANGQNTNQLMSGQAPQQGGEDGNKTTSRDLPERKEAPAEEVAAE